MKRKNSGVALNYSRLENITVTISERDMKDALFAKAEEIARDCLEDVSGWGKHIKIKKQHDGVGIMSEDYAEVVFTRRIEENDQM